MAQIDNLLPEGCECRLDFFIYSPSADIEVVVGLKGMRSLPSIPPTRPVIETAKAFGAAVAPLEELADDWRLMTRAEIADYKRRNESEGRSEDDEDALGDEF